MNTEVEKEIKKEFEVERLIFFSDAVFAIIITIMILDVKLPEALIHPTEDESKRAFVHIIPKLGAYAASFLVIGSFWMRHLKVFSFLKDYNKQLLALNLLFLFSLSLFPFALSFAFSSSYIMQYTWGIYTYIGIVYMAFFTQSLLIGYLIRNREALCERPDEMEDILRWKVRRLSLFAVPILFVLMLCAGYFHISMYYVFGSMIGYGILVGRLKKKLYPDHKNDDVTLISFFRKVNVEKRGVKRVKQ